MTEQERIELNKLITEWLGECWHDFKCDKPFGDAFHWCSKCSDYYYTQTDYTRDLNALVGKLKEKKIEFDFCFTVVKGKIFFNAWVGSSEDIEDSDPCLALVRALGEYIKKEKK